MKLILGVILSSSLYAGVGHLPLDLSFEESLKLYKEYQSQNKTNKEKLQINGDFDQYSSDMEIVASSGEKLGSWLKKINETRPNNPLRLTSRSTQRGITIDKPSKYSPKIVSERFIKLKAQMPKSMQDILYGNATMTTTTDMPDKDFIKLARMASSLYQTATRWNMMERWLPQLSQRRVKDIRGYHKLMNTKNLDSKLSDLSSIPPQEASELTQALIGACINATQRLDNTCQSYVLQNTENLLAIKNQIMPRAKQMWDSFFKISTPRTDVEWIPNGPNVMKVVFKNIQDPEIAAWLKSNVEDEFKLDKENFSMELNYISGVNGTAFLEFKPGVTPHVSGGNKIVMDSNTNIQEYGVRWTIRHEFGHILRLPDCYTEFYDDQEKVMVNYQLDTTDLMCSRAGLMNERIYKELKEKYMK